MLSRIGSVCGRPLYCDKCTLSKLKLGYARILVEMDSIGEFPEVIKLQDEKGFVFHQKLVCEWRLLVCVSCKKFGHVQQECKDGRPNKMVWKVKDKLLQISGKIKSRSRMYVKDPGGMRKVM